MIHVEDARVVAIVNVDVAGESVQRQVKFRVDEQEQHVLIHREAPQLLAQLPGFELGAVVRGVNRLWPSLVYRQLTGSVLLLAADDGVKAFRVKCDVYVLVSDEEPIDGPDRWLPLSILGDCVLRHFRRRGDTLKYL